MTDFQFQLLIGTVVGSMLLVILAVVVAARVLYLESKESQKKAFVDLVEVHGDLQKRISKIYKKIKESK